MKNNPEQFPLIKETALLLDGPVGQLEAMTTWPENNEPKAVGIICHPHPLYLGTMLNKVVTTVTRAFQELNLATVRFNYRGVGKSEGEYGHMTGEIEDLRAILTWIKQVLPEQKIWLAGFSFGSFVAASMANQRDDIAQLFSIAPPVDHQNFSGLTNIHCPWVVIQGDHDEVVSPQSVIQWAENPPSPLTFILIPGVSHFFHGHLVELRELIISSSI